MNDPNAQTGTVAQQLVLNTFKALIVALLIAASSGGILAWRDLGVLSAVVQELRTGYITDAATLGAIAQQAHANTLHREAHEKTAVREIARIDANERRSHANELEITRLQRSPSARPDAFTGSDGAVLLRRIEELERLQQVK